MSQVLELVRRDPVLAAAAVLAVASCALVPPDAGYLAYVDVRTLGLLFCLMATMAGLSRAGVFQAAGRALVARLHSGTSVVMGLVLLPFLASMLVTNDVSLIAFVPFALLVLRMLGIADASIFTVVMMTVAANLGSMLTPIGNPAEPLPLLRLRNGRRRVRGGSCSRTRCSPPCCSWPASSPTARTAAACPSAAATTTSPRRTGSSRAACAGAPSPPGRRSSC